MAKIVEHRSIPLDDLVIGMGQARVQGVGKGIEDLANSIKVMGLLQPIVVCTALQEGKWEILTGQRRFLAHKMLRVESITAAVLDERVEEGEAKAISITENLIRRTLSGKDLIDGITYLYRIYGSAKAVADTTGIPYNDVRHYVKYPRLAPTMKELVDAGEIDIKVALKAQDSATESDKEPDIEVAVMLAHAMENMTGVQRKKVVQDRQRNPERPIEETIEAAKSGSKITQIIVSVTQDAHDALQRFAKEEGSTQDEAAASLIEEALITHGFLEE